jgi:hypothetical protein
VFEICVEKGSELPQGRKPRKFKGRTVFQGNNVRDDNADVALFSELGSSPATMGAGKFVDAYGSRHGLNFQSIVHWTGKYRRPVVLQNRPLWSP